MEKHCRLVSVSVIVALIWLSSPICGDHIPVNTQPQQIHISATGDPTQMMVTWNTFNSTNKSVVEFGPSEKLTKTAVGYSTKFVDPGEEQRVQFIHRVLLTKLTPGHQYTYHCGSPEGWSPLFTFKALKSGSDWSPRLAVYGDMGNENAQSLGRLQEETQKGMYDAFLHVGDFAYDFNEDNGRIGDSFMRQIESIAAYVPYMTCTGNHEHYYNFTHYKNRFTMPNFNQSQNLWYSWNLGPAHIVAFSTEAFFFLEALPTADNQMAWLEQDLKEAAKAENRKEHPWIITMGHRPAYCTNSDHDDCTQYEGIVRRHFEDLFYKYGVDVEFWAHEHTYERLWPVYNEKVYNGTTAPYTDPKAPVHIITGSAGNRERLDGFGPMKAWSAFRASDYGYTRMHLTNKTHISFEQVSDDKDGKVIDSFTLIKHQHGFQAWL